MKGNVAVVRGVERLYGAPVMATDLRALGEPRARGPGGESETIIDRIYHLDRGYEVLEKKIAAVGAQMQRIN